MAAEMAFAAGVAPQAAAPVAAPLLRGAEPGAARPSAAAAGAPLAWAAAAAAVGGTAATAAGRGRTRRARRTARAADFMKVAAPKPSLNPDQFSDVCEQTGVTLSRYMIELSKRGVVDADLNSIMSSISEGTKVIASLIAKAPLRQADLLGLEGEVNVQGEDQKKLDVITNEVLKNALRYTGKLGTLASEEEDNPVAVDDDLNDEFNTKVVGETGSYVCVFDPLDGSSNVDAGIPVGTIFGIFKEPEGGECDLNLDGGEVSEADQACLAATLQPGNNLVAAGYVFYSASTEFVVTFGNGVVGFTLDRDICDYKLTRPEIKIPKRGSIYSLNLGQRGTVG
ncbi:unnamed protein product [Prorocentrum cordatum]|uniref:fructose-bisphosphatase n=1 Tax=Prorocentrum cordatum TaxID=2364126 RepID=A0ABN9QWS0_9DINO|nr:unnamed protein product [Polarella glacialis]